MKLSVIVPIFNAESTLERCVGSVLAQGFADFELLLIDDGSTDMSGRMADRYAEEDKRVKVFHKANGGLSDARNHGIERATGEYITFIDSDDEITPHTLAQLISTAENHSEYEIIEYPMLERPNRADEHLFNPGCHEYKNALDWLEPFGLEHCWACNKIYRRTLFSDVRFTVGIKFEDVNLLSKLLIKNPFIATTNYGCYIYHWNEKGIVAESKTKDLSPLLKEQINLVEKLGIDTRERRWHRLYLNMLTAQLYSYRSTGRILLWPQRIAVKRYHGASDVVKALMLNTLGLRLTCLLFSLVTKIKRR